MMLPGCVGEREVGSAADSDADDGEQHGVGYRKALGERQQQAHQPEQGRDGEDCLDGIGHGCRLAEPTGNCAPVTRRTGQDCKATATVDGGSGAGRKQRSAAAGLYRHRAKGPDVKLAPRAQL